MTNDESDDSITAVKEVMRSSLTGVQDDDDATMKEMEPLLS